MIPIAAMKNSHAGRPGVVMGGGPSLEADLRQIPKDAILIAVNHHAFDYIVCADYTVFLDDITRFTVPQEDIRLLGGVLVSRQQESDVDLTGADWWHGLSAATWRRGWRAGWAAIQCCWPGWTATRASDRKMPIHAIMPTTLRSKNIWPAGGRRSQSAPTRSGSRRSRVRW